MGQVKLTDFGIAALAQVEGSPGGTPAYMTPEQAEGRPATMKGDIYALGLVLFEMFTGRRAIEASSLFELRRHHQERRLPPRPTTLVPSLDLRIEEAILACLQHDPSDRPASAAHVAALLPGGDLLRAVRDAGGLPSPDMVGSAGGSGRLHPWVARGLVAMVALGLGVGAWNRDRVSVVGQLPETSSPELLTDKARTLLRNLGYRWEAPVSAFGFVPSTPFMRKAALDLDADRWWQMIRAGWPPAVTFWYRESPASLAATRLDRTQVFKATTLDDPPIGHHSRRVSLDASGRLVALEAMVSEFGGGSTRPPIELAWRPTFEAAGLDYDRFVRTEATWTPPVPFERRYAWLGPPSEDVASQVRVEGAESGNRIVAFELVGRWGRIAEQEQNRVAAWFGMFVLVMIGTGAVLGLRNARSGHSDVRAAGRVAVLTFALLFLSCLLLMDPGNLEFDLLLRAIEDSTLWAIEVLVFYLVIEPYIRGRSPEVLIGWTRLVQGRFQDPLVARQVLIGLSLAAAVFAVASVSSSPTVQLSHAGSLDLALSGPRWASFVAGEIGRAFWSAFAICGLFVLFRNLGRLAWLAAAITALVFAVTQSSGMMMPFGPWGDIGLGALLVFSLLRFGLVTLATFVFFGITILAAPLTMRPSAWFFGVSFAVIAGSVALAAWSAFLSAGAGQPGTDQLRREAGPRSQPS